MRNVTCAKCGWVYIAYTQEQAQKEFDAFNAYFDSCSKKKQELYWGSNRSSIDNYIGCRCCGGKEFREFREGDCPPGCAIGPVIA